MGDWLLLIIIMILYFCLKHNYPKLRGYMGEYWVKRELNKLSEDYIVLNNLMIEVNNITHQIDHIVISKYGIFVIETKNYYGMITGNENSEKWVQHLGKNRFYFKNPIHQNYGHIKALEESLNISNDKFVSIICISNQARIKTSTTSNVINLDNLNNIIKSYENEILFDDLYHIKNKVLNINIVSKEKRKQHVNNIQTKINNEKELINNFQCPKCGNKLIKKKGKYGYFIGCNNYPKCKYIKK